MLIAGHRMSGTGLGTAQFAFGHGTEQEAVATVHAALACARRQVAYLAYSPFGGPAGPPPGLALEVAERRGVSVHRVLLAWLRDQSPGILPLVGASRPASIRDSATPLDLTDRDRADLAS